jgi:CheY-like chemotaxis protein
MSKQEAYSLLFQSGFSTNDQTDQLAGRGVGMDVVRSYISELRGVINTDSTPNLGTTFTIRLPLTLSITKALCCVHQNYNIAFPIDGVEDVIDLAPEQLIKGEGDQPFVMWRERRLPCKPLVQLLSYNRTLKRSSSYLSPTGDKVSVIILRSGDDFIGLQVDEVLGEQEIVIKQLAGPVPKPLGISGVTVQGDGLVMPIADVLELVELSLDRLEVNHQFWKSLAETPLSEVQSEPMVLIVDDSITVRELLSMTFSKAGYRVEQARDGLEAWEKLRSGLPCDLIFCDVEMPRMDGLELLSRLQQDPDLQDLPIAMLTSRGASKHKKMAANLGAKGYFTKPYLEEVLLDAAQRMINGEVLVK